MATRKKTTTQPKKRRRKSRYITGLHVSPKCSGTIKYRSGWELSVLKSLDDDANVASYLYEAFHIPYLANVRTGKIRKYIPDFYITYANGQRKVVEVKRKDKVAEPKTAKKLLAGKAWCDKNNIIFEVWTDATIVRIRKELEAKGIV